MKPKAKMFVFILAVILATSGVLYFVFSPIDVELLEMSKSTADITFVEQGENVYKDEYIIYPLVGGEVVNVNVEQGQKVIAGQALVEVDVKDIEYEIEQLQAVKQGNYFQAEQIAAQRSTEIAELEATKKDLQGSLKTLEAQIELWEGEQQSLDDQIQWQTDVVSANRTMVTHARRISDLVEGAMPLEEEHQAKINKAQASAQLAASRLQLSQLESGAMPEDFYEGQKESIEAQIELADYLIEQDSSKNMQNFYYSQANSVQATISKLVNQQGKAENPTPFGGVIRELYVTKSNIVSPTEPIALIGEHPCIRVFVPVREIEYLSLGDSVEIESDSREEEKISTGKIVEIKPEAEVLLTPLGIEESKVEIIIEPEEVFIIGEKLEIKFFIAQKTDALVVPKTALFEKDKKDTVWIVQDGKLEYREVVLGMETTDSYVVVDGISSGEKIVLDSSQTELTENKRVKE